jgi:hypothetical protein
MPGLVHGSPTSEQLERPMSPTTSLKALARSGLSRLTRSWSESFDSLIDWDGSTHRRQTEARRRHDKSTKFCAARVFMIRQRRTPHGGCLISGRILQVRQRASWAKSSSSASLACHLWEASGLATEEMQIICIAPTGTGAVVLETDVRNPETTST